MLWGKVVLRYCNQRIFQLLATDDQSMPGAWCRLHHRCCAQSGCSGFILHATGVSGHLIILIPIITLLLAQLWSSPLFRFLLCVAVVSCQSAGVTLRAGLPGRGADSGSLVAFSNVLYWGHAASWLMLVNFAVWLSAAKGLHCSASII